MGALTYFYNSLTCFSLPLLFLFTAPHPQRSLQDVIDQLTKNKREWILSGTEITLGNRCKNGEVLVFLNDYSVIHKLCKKGTWETTIEKWTISNANDEIKININGEEYFVVLGKKNKKEKLVLRTFKSGKKDLVVDRVFLSGTE